jgi:hypothetical protein
VRVAAARTATSQAESLIVAFVGLSLRVTIKLVDAADIW